MQAPHEWVRASSLTPPCRCLQGGCFSRRAGPDCDRQNENAMPVRCSPGSRNPYAVADRPTDHGAAALPPQLRQPHEAYFPDPWANYAPPSEPATGAAGPLHFENPALKPRREMVGGPRGARSFKLNGAGPKVSASDGREGSTKRGGDFGANRSSSEEVRDELIRVGQAQHW